MFFNILINLPINSTTDEVHSILILGENNDIQPNKIKLDKNWLWYTVYDGEIPMPMMINAYDQDGTFIYGK